MVANCHAAMKPFGSRRGLLAAVGSAAVLASDAQTPGASSSTCIPGGDEGSCLPGDSQVLEQQAWRIRGGGLQLEIQRIGNSLRWGSVEWTVNRTEEMHAAKSRVAPVCRHLQLGPLFEVQLRQGRRKRVSSASCTLAGGFPDAVSAAAFAAEFDCPAGLKVRWQVQVQGFGNTGDVDHMADKLAGAAARIIVALAGAKESAPERLSVLLLPKDAEKRCGRTKPVGGRFPCNGG